MYIEQSKIIGEIVVFLQRQRIDILAHAKIFSPFEWCLCFFTFLASSFCYMLTGRSKSKLKETKKKCFSQEFYHASEEVYNSALNLTFSARGIRPSRAIIALTAGVSYFLLFSHYSADLTAVITVLPPAPAITSFQVRNASKCSTYFTLFF